MRPLTILLASGLLSACAFSAHAEQLDSAQAVATFVDSATRHVLLVSPTLYSRPVADAIRRAAVERGVTVHILAEAARVEEPAAYLAGLSRLPRVEVRVVQRIDHSVLVTDQRYVLTGPTVWQLPHPSETMATVVIDLQQPSADAARLRSWWDHLAALWPKAPRYRYDPRTHIPPP